MTVRRFIIAAIAPVVVYLLAAFVAWEFDPGKWTENSRAGTAILAVLFYSIALLFQGKDD